MKKLLVVLVVLIAVTLMASVAMAGVAGTKHDMRTHTSTALPNGEVCVYCHTPHSSGNNTLLWNRTILTYATYQAYASNTLQGTPSATVGSQTAVCLSCHDGAAAIGAMINPPNYGGYVTGSYIGNINASGQITGAAVLNADFRDDHPVSIDYNVTDTGLQPTATVIAAGLPLYANGLLLNVECGSCHNVHGGAANTPFLRISNASSNLCTTCHIK